MEIWVHRNGQYAGRFSESAIREKVADGSLSGTDLAWDEAKSAWKPISEFLAAVPSEKTDSIPASEAEAKPAPKPSPPPLPSMPIRAAGPPPLPTPVPGPGLSIPAPVPPEGEKIWNPYIAILGS